MFRLMRAIIRLTNTVQVRRIKYNCQLDYTSRSRVWTRIRYMYVQCLNQMFDAYWWCRSSLVSGLGGRRGGPMKQCLVCCRCKCSCSCPCGVVCPDEWWIQIKSTRNSPCSDALWCGVWKSLHSVSPCSPLFF